MENRGEEYYLQASLYFVRSISAILLGLMECCCEVFSEIGTERVNDMVLWSGLNDWF